jgi:hypothetical protein
VVLHVYRTNLVNGYILNFFKSYSIKYFFKYLHLHHVHSVIVPYKLGERKWKWRLVTGYPPGL